MHVFVSMHADVHLDLCACLCESVYTVMPHPVLQTKLRQLHHPTLSVYYSEKQVNINRVVTPNNIDFILDTIMLQVLSYSSFNVTNNHTDANKKYSCEQQ